MLERFKSIYSSVVLSLILVAVSLYTTHLIVTQGLLVGPIVIVALMGILLLGWMMRDYKMGIYYMFVLSVFMSFINRILPSPVQFGVILDAIASLTFVIMLITDRGKADWSAIKGPITYMYVIVVVYQLLQVFNPNATSFLGWIVAFRANTSFLLFFAFFHLFLSFEEVKKFTMLWIAMASIVAFYGIWQQVFGLTGFELDWVHATEGRTKLLIVWGQQRKFSLLSDPSAFGLFMAFSALSCLILALGPLRGIYRLILVFLGMSMMLSMSFSGTRTAFAMIIVGIAFYIVMTLKSRKTFFVMIAAGVVGVAVLFGPFYGGTVQRIRSTLNPSEDASMSVRDKKRIRLQSYVQSHPFGGGLNTTGPNGLKYSPGHPLAEGWDADSGYLLTALEMGWIGLILGMLFFFAVMVKGINNYFSIRDPMLKTITLAYIVPFMALSVAHFTQDAMFQKPVYLVIIATYAMMLTIPTLDKNKSN